MECLKQEIPFNKISNNDLLNTFGFKKIIPFSKSNTQDIKQSVKTLNDSTENSIKCDYYTMKEFLELKTNSKNTFAMMHLNISSLSFHFDKLCDFLRKAKKLVDFKIIGITESRLKANCPPTINIDIPNYNIEHQPTESGKGGALFYISSDLNYKVRDDLKAYKSKELETIFIEIINKKYKNYIIGCIYRHPK